MLLQVQTQADSIKTTIVADSTATSKAMPSKEVKNGVFAGLGIAVLTILVFVLYNLRSSNK